jgi:chaperonin GroES
MFISLLRRPAAVVEAGRRAGRSAEWRRLRALSISTRPVEHRVRAPTPKHEHDQREDKEMKLRPLYDRLLVTRTEEKQKTTGGLFIPDTAKEKPMEGEVIAAGPGARNEAGALVPLDVKAGDRILFGKWSGTEVKLNGEDLLIMKESDIMGIITVTAARKKAA